MEADAGTDELHVGQVADDHVAEHDVLLDDLVFGLGQLARLAQDLVRDPDLPDVVQQTGHADVAMNRPAEAQPLGQEDA